MRRGSPNGPRRASSWYAARAPSTCTSRISRYDVSNVACAVPSFCTSSSCVTAPRIPLASQSIDQSRCRCSGLMSLTFAHEWISRIGGIGGAGTAIGAGGVQFILGIDVHKVRRGRNARSPGKHSRAHRTQCIHLVERKEPAAVGWRCVVLCSMTRPSRAVHLACLVPSVSGTQHVRNAGSQRLWARSQRMCASQRVSTRGWISCMYVQ